MSDALQGVQGPVGTVLYWLRDMLPRHGVGLVGPSHDHAHRRTETVVLSGSCTTCVSVGYRRVNLMAYAGSRPLRGLHRWQVRTRHGYRDGTSRVTGLGLLRLPVMGGNAVTHHVSMGPNCGTH